MARYNAVRAAYLRVLSKENAHRVAKTAHLTCQGSPIQIEGTTEDGRIYYIRWRHDYLTINVSDKGEKSAMAGVNGVLILDRWVDEAGALYDPYMRVLREVAMDFHLPQSCGDSETWNRELAEL